VTCKFSDTVVLARSHTAPVLDTDWSPHSDTSIAPYCKDGDPPFSVSTVPHAIVGLAKFSEYLIVAEVRRLVSPELVSLDGRTFATGQFLPSMQMSCKPASHTMMVGGGNR
jgi:hypothetical protein